jgi:hypothetical protein
MSYDVNPESNEISFNFINSAGEKASFSFKAWLEKNSVMGLEETRTPAISCLCNNAESCDIGANERGNVTCVFPQGIIPSKENTKFALEGNIMFANRPENPIKIDGQIYRAIHDADLHNVYSNDFIAYMAVTLIFLIIYAILIVFFGKTKKLKDWIKSSWKKYLIVALIFFIIINFAIMQVTSNYDPIQVPIYSFVISLILAFPIGVIIGIILHFKNKKKDKKNNK